MFTKPEGTNSKRITHPGKAWPLGSSITSRGVNFAVAAPEAKEIHLLIFSNPNAEYATEVFVLNNQNHSGDYWHIEVEGLEAGCLYGYKVISPNSQDRSISPSNKVLLDPCARAIEGWDVYQRNSATGSSDNINKCLKGVVCERDHFDFESHPRPKHPWDKTIIYELHVGNFTNHKNSIDNSKNAGTFLGLIEKIPYLKDLGITSIELLPIFAFDSLDAPNGKTNKWGYNPLNWFAPHTNYISSQSPLSGRQQIRELVAAFHDQGIEVLVDVVYNHTTEGNQNGPIISWKGFGESIYYQQSKTGEYLDVSGCGNTIAANSPLARKLIIESMHCWANELGIDGFRFDLGIALSRGSQLHPLDNPPLFEEIEADPRLCDLKLISEPWDCGGLYRLADFPAKRFSTWNGKFRDNTRKFWKSDKGSTWPLKDQLKGSPDLYQDQKGSTKYSINFITAHDGFTLHDLVSFNSKHNFANSESNCDGENNNHSWNHGIEGPSSDPNIINLRNKQKRNLLTTLLLTPGIPMLSMGDETSRSQGGNNNSWCQESPIGLMNWGTNSFDRDLHSFVKNLLLIRKNFPDLFSPSMPHQEKNTTDDIDSSRLFIEWHGIKNKKPDWSNWSHTISFSLNKSDSEYVMWMGLNAYIKPMKFELPKTNSFWQKIVDTSILDLNHPSFKNDLLNQESIELEERSMKVLITKEYLSQKNKKF